MTRDDLFDKRHIIEFERQEGDVAIPSDAEYRTLFDVKDVHGFQEKYYGPDGAGLKKLSGQEALTLLERKQSGKGKSGREAHGDVEMKDGDAKTTTDILSIISSRLTKEFGKSTQSPEIFHARSDGWCHHKQPGPK